MKEDTGEGIRERKKEDTLNKIGAISLKLFSEKGYNETTLDDIALGAGISRRTFFSYFKSKEEIIQLWQGEAFGEDVYNEIIKADNNQQPVRVACECLLKLIDHHESKDTIRIDKLIHSTEALRLRKQLVYLRWEEKVFEGLCVLFPGKKQQQSLRITSMVCIGAMRIGMEEWRKDDAKHSLKSFVRKQFSILQADYKI